MTKFHVPHTQTAFVLIGGVCSGKSTWCRKNIPEANVIGLDKCRAILNGKLEWHNSLNQPAAELQNVLIEQHARLGNTIAIDGTNIDGKFRKSLVQHLRDNGYVVVFVMFEDTLYMGECIEREARRRANENLPVIPTIAIERFATKYKNLDRKALELQADCLIDSTDELLWNEYRYIKTDRDVLFVGDLHDMFPKMRDALKQYDYYFDDEGYLKPHVAGARPLVVFLGDLMDRGTHSVETVRAVIEMVKSGNAYCVRGNHDDTAAKLMNNGMRTNSSMNTIKTVSHWDEALDEETFSQYRDFLSDLPVALVIDNGQPWVATHAGCAYDSEDPRGIRQFLMPSKVNYQIMLRGWPTNEKTKAGYRKLAPVETLRDNPSSEYNMVYGHVNPTAEDEEVIVPYVKENPLGTKFVCLESRIEDGPEYPIGLYLVPASATL